MNEESQEFLDAVPRSIPVSFERRLDRLAARLGLERALVPEELRTLYQAAFWAAVCNIALNGWGGCGGQIKSDREYHRVFLEHAFMETRDRLFATRGWRRLPRCRQGEVRRIFLTVRVADENLAR